MKHMKKLIVAMIAVMMLALGLLVGCGSAPASIEGTTWKVTAMEYNGTDYLSMLGDAQITMSFGADGKVTENVKGTVLGETVDESSDLTTYTYENGKLTIEGQTYTVSGNKITIEAEGAKITMEKQ